MTSLKISQLIESLEKIKNENGDLEVFSLDEKNKGFAGVSQTICLVAASTKEMYVALITGGDIIRV